MEGIKSVEKFLLGRFLPGYELYIIYQQYIDTAVFIPKCLGSMCADSIDEIVGELFRRNIKHLHAMLDSHIANSVEEVCFSQPNTAI